MTSTVSNLDVTNELDRPALVEQLRRCCASQRWADRVAEGRPYGSTEDLKSASDRAFSTLEAADLEEAMAAHPRIGERVTGTDTESSWSRREQAAVLDADQSVEDALHAGNVAYEERFGHVFLIFASGKSAEEMLGALRDRLGNDRETEWVVIAEELRKITRLRLDRMVGL